ncbi:kinase-like domain-containing protein, partial [Pisolithus albus]
IWSQLQHDNVMPLLGIVTNFNNTVSMVTEWVERGNAHDYVQDVAVDPRPLLVDIAHGLNYLHDSGIVHGDLKGTNILVSGTGCALVTDFGFSRQCNPPPGHDVDPPRGSSLRWLAPENLDTWATNRQADIWAFGMTVLELFSRKNPFHEARMEHTIMLRISRGPPSRPSNEATCFRLCDTWWNICLECWKSDPSARPAVKDIVADL